MPEKYDIPGANLLKDVSAVDKHTKFSEISGWDEPGSTSLSSCLKG